MVTWENSGFSVDASVRITLNGIQLRVYCQHVEHLLRYCARGCCDTKPNDGNPSNTRHSWRASALPFLEKKIGDVYDFTKDWYDGHTMNPVAPNSNYGCSMTRVSVFTCPSSPGRTGLTELDAVLERVGGMTEAEREALLLALRDQPDGKGKKTG
jgi:hypothetical protein